MWNPGVPRFLQGEARDCARHHSAYAKVPYMSPSRWTSETRRRLLRSLLAEYGGCSDADVRELVETRGNGAVVSSHGLNPWLRTVIRTFVKT